MGSGGSKAKNSGSNDLNNQEFSQFMIEEHNRCRKRHGSPPLKHSLTCEREAQEWAEKLGQTGYKEHNTQQKDFGESIYKATKPVSPREIVDAWYAQNTTYNYEEPNFSHRTGYFTQLVWRESEFVGVGRSQTKHGTFVVVNYDPPGNILYEGQFEYNVQEPQGHG
ncbi:Golgi-associated plant pathogenesis-related protein 1-like [Symsagittifera roscoffensis]|uniref:Golgi-associated plant pathogenesis-related protein 1-like n=1 Tax=Symsagittifera roscoffensis TaxID=84072 RepID=UPI00307C712D